MIGADLFKSLAKYTYYELYNKKIFFEQDAAIGYVFHTEKIYNDDCFYILKDFVRSYYDIAGVKCILTVMTPENYYIRREMELSRCDVREYIDRVNELSCFSEIGYHGHFYHDNHGSAGVKGNDHTDLIADQFDREVLWLADNIDNFVRVYAAGWWYMTKFIISRLAYHNFNMDFSFTYSNNFGCDYSRSFLMENAIPLGKAFYMKGYRDLIFVQNFIGCHDNRYQYDFVRRMNNFFRDNVCYDESCIGVVNNHDYNLMNGNDYNTLKCIEVMLNDPKINIINPVQYGINPMQYEINSDAV